MTHTEENCTASPDSVPTTAKTPPQLGRAQAVAATVAVALPVNLVIWAIGVAVGGSFEYTDAGKTQSAAPGGVVVMTAIPLLIGMTSAALLSYRWPGVIRLAQVVGPTIALLTIGGTLAADFDGASTVALSAMHIAIVPILIVGLEAMRRGLGRRQAHV